ncbi:diguanylate cyclase (GGDEF) domain-containing protein [Dethiosulfatibacter aminovorans DSM 17477]|uniref:Diguanylate cyclase (GGDEF) domain-containing protein n=1 Tax=Dethiosulfatibacter aminovorans DSM 17477 TaxID=1121476 RepID=A0A1M6F791_9FIRM|nr:diguanylate cyclase [Dethiosulfatibacter aminovorans]SHI93567.1 diguanylate cyclase (GGDEF) domain-containing protein [Dethiosulfatibacter aminovorans DSM 17477]
MVNKIRTMLSESKDLALENPRKSYDLAVKAYELAERYGLEIEKGMACFKMAYACRVMSDYSNGLDYALKALDIFKENNHIDGIIKVRNIIGIIYFYFGDYSTALENFSQALEDLEYHENMNLKASILNNIGEIYREAGQYDRAIEYFEDALDISIEFDLRNNISSIYLNLGEVFGLDNRNEESMECIKKSYAIAKTSRSVIIQGEAETKLGKAMCNRGDYQKAQDYYFSALTKYNKVNNKFYLVELLINMAELDETMGTSPVNNLREALNNALEMGLESKVSSVYKLLAEYYERNHEYKHALEYFKSYHLKEKELEATNLAKKLEIISIEFDYFREKSENDKFKALSEKLKREVDESAVELERIKAQNANLVKETLIDELTKLYNRRGIRSMFSKVLGEICDETCAIFIIDIDFFKKYNDSWGHIQGDVCLKKISNCLKNLPYENYFAGRFGGEEFLLYIKVESFEEAVEKGEYVRQAVEALKLSYSKEEDSSHVTVSLGGKTGIVDMNNVNRIIDEADRELYLAKEQGRNRLSISMIEKNNIRYI